MAKLQTTIHSFVFFLTFLTFSIPKCLSSYDQDEFHWLDNKDDEVSMVQIRHDTLRSCDFSKGKWVYDQTYPLYDTSCPFLSSPVTCQKNGRPDSGYEKLKWKPDSCSLPRFDALEFLGKMRRKRMMLVGDSIMRNQWESLVCLVQYIVPAARKTVIYNGPTMAFLALDYEMSIEFCWAPLLVELKRGQDNKRILHLDLIEENAKYWRGIDVLLFDSAHWWTHADKYRSWDFAIEGNKFYSNINPEVAYEKGLNTWARWIDMNLDPRRTRVFFRSMSPTHNRGNGLKCDNHKEPLGYFEEPHIQEQVMVLQKVVRKMGFPVYVQDITTMSTYRRDAHPSIYASRDKNHQKLDDHNSSDCSHWCLPGVPDTWNEVLNAIL